MPPKDKMSSSGWKTPVSPVKHLLLHDVTNQTAPVNAASHRRMIVTPLAAGAAIHARHHVSRHAQS